MEKIKELKSLIYAKFDSESALASALGWNRQRLNKITNGKKEPDLEEVQAIAEKLERPFTEVAYIFLNKQSPNGQLKCG